MLSPLLPLEAIFVGLLADAPAAAAADDDDDDPLRPCCLSIVSLSLLAKLSAAAVGGDSSRSVALVNVLFKDLGFGLGAEEDDGVEEVDEEVEEFALVVGKSRTRSGVCFLRAGDEVSFCFQNSRFDLTAAP